MTVFQFLANFDSSFKKQREHIEMYLYERQALQHNELEKQNRFTDIKKNICLVKWSSFLVVAIQNGLNVGDNFARRTNI